MQRPGDAGHAAVSPGGQQEAMPAAPCSNNPFESPRAAATHSSAAGYPGTSGHVPPGAWLPTAAQQQLASSAPATPTWQFEQPWARPAGAWPDQQGRQEQQRHAGLPAAGSSNQAAAAADVLHSLFLQQPGARQIITALLSNQPDERAAANVPGHDSLTDTTLQAPQLKVPADHYSMQQQPAGAAALASIRTPEPSYSQTALGVPWAPNLAAPAPPATPFSQQAWMQLQLQHQQQQAAMYAAAAPMALASQQWGQAWQGQQQFVAPGAAAVPAATLVCHPLMPGDPMQQAMGMQAMHCAQFVPVAGMIGLVGGLGMHPAYGAAGGVHTWQQFGQQQQQQPAGGFQAGEPQQGPVVESVAPSEAAGLSPQSSALLPGPWVQPACPGRQASAGGDAAQLASTSAAATATSTAGSVATWLLSPVSAAVGWLLRPAAQSVDRQHSAAAAPAASQLAAAPAQAAGSLVCACASAAEAAVLLVVYALHQQLVVSLYCLLAASAAAAVSGRIALSAGRTAAQGSAGLAWFAAREARLFARSAAAVAVADLQTLPQQLLRWQDPGAAPAASSNPGRVSDSSVDCNEAGSTPAVVVVSKPAAGQLGVSCSASSSMLLAADSTAVLCGLYSGLGVKMWFLLTVWVPLQAARIWTAAWVQGWLMSLSACQAAADVLLQLAWSLACCTKAATSSITSSAKTGLAAAAGGGGLLSAAVWLVAAGLNQVAAPVAAHAWQLATTAAVSVPGGLIALQLLQVMAGWWCAAALAGMRLLACASDAEGARSSLNVRGVGWQGLQLVLHLLQQAGAAACAVARAWAITGAEWCLLGASPVTRAAVIGMAGLVQHLAVETAAAAWRLGVALYQAHQEGERSSTGAGGMLVAP